MKKFLKADKFYFPYTVKKNGYLEIIDGKFGDFTKTIPSGSDEILDYTGYTVAPGLVDTHIHGIQGLDVMDSEDDYKIIISMSKELLKFGVTSWMPTILTSSKKTIGNICQAIGKAQEQNEYSKIIGIFLEGPYFTKEHKGAQNSKYMTPPIISDILSWNRLSGGIIRKVALAPELPGSSEFISQMKEAGIYVALGHSNATFEESNQAIEDGASIFVHTYNGMRGFDHREPGVVGAALTSSSTFTELICDGNHVHRAAMKMLIDQRGENKVVLVTDSIRATGLPDGLYTLGDFNVKVEKGIAMLKEGAGLAGSTLMLKNSVKNAVEWELSTKSGAIRMATLTPAKSVGMESFIGQIKKGCYADFVILDNSLNLVSVFLNGEEQNI